MLRRDKRFRKAEDYAARGLSVLLGECDGCAHDNRKPSEAQEREKERAFGFHDRSMKGMASRSLPGPAWKRDRSIGGQTARETGVEINPIEVALVGDDDTAPVGRDAEVR